MRVAAAAAGNSRLHFELDTMGDSGLQVMLTEPSQVDGRWVCAKPYPRTLMLYC